MKHAQPYEFRLAGTCAGTSPWRVFVGEGVPAPAAQRLKELFLQPRYTLLHAVEPDRPPEPALLEDLLERGYAPQTIRLSIFMRGHGTPRKPRTIRVPSPGGLAIRWGWLDYDHSPDITGAWAAPAARSDLNLLFHALNDIIGSTPSRLAVSASARTKGAQTELRELGWDFRTLDFRAKKAKPAASPKP